MSVVARNAALREIVRQVPALIGATHLGYSHQVTQKHAVLTAEPMSRYRRGHPLRRDKAR
ncbi:MAG TPA: hypothetical protein VMK84_00930 [Streptosporangiaceae bacterium]|nr:hypothetical protein [Streptosporangiaceae bacterium]